MTFWIEMKWDFLRAIFGVQGVKRRWCWHRGQYKHLLYKTHYLSPGNNFDFCIRCNHIDGFSEDET